MGIYSDIQSDVAEAFNTDLSDAVQDLDYIEVIRGEYDPETGLPLEIKKVTKTRGVSSPIDTSHLDGEVFKVGDMEFLILHSELDAKPDVSQIIRLAGIEYSINTVGIDPAGAMWVITGRTT